jgi:hypothetical protein
MTRIRLWLFGCIKYYFDWKYFITITRQAAGRHIFTIGNTYVLEPRTARALDKNAKPGRELSVQMDIKATRRIDK